MPNSPFIDLHAVRQPIENANGLPNAHYTDPNVHGDENQSLLMGQWCGLGVAADVPEPGDAVPVTFAGMPLLLIRDRLGVVRVFQNICGHRGMILVETPRKIEGAIRCPYHSWCYSTEGKLVSTPHVGGPGHNTHASIDRALLGLVEVRAHVWRDVVWINVSGDAPEFAVAMADIIKRWAAFEQPLYHGGADSRFTLELNCNWKLVVENYCESYHLPWVHPDLNVYSRLEDHYHIEAPGRFSGQGTSVYRQIKDEAGGVFTDFDGLRPEWDTAAEYIAVYPNVLFGAHRDHAFVIVLLPDGPGKTREEVHIYYATDQSDAALRGLNTTQWKKVLSEDISVVEGMQRGRSAPGFDGGRFSPVMDGPTHMFHAWVATQVEQHRSTALAGQ